MKKLNFNMLAVAFVIASLFTIGCSKEENLEQNTTHDTKKDVIGWLEKLIKKKARIQFGHNEPDAECVYKGLCYIEIGGTSGHGASGYLDGDHLYVAFFKEDLSTDDINYHFENNEFEVIEGINFSSDGIDNSSSDFFIEENVYEVSVENDDFIVVQY